LFGFSEPALLEEAEIAGGVENDVVEEGNAEDFAGLLDLAGDINIRGRGVEAALGVVVGQDEAGGAVGQDFGKNFARVDRGTVQESHGDDADVQDLVGAIARRLKPKVLPWLPDYYVIQMTEKSK